MEQMNKETNIILFGAGKMGLEALDLLGDKVSFFCDTSVEKVGTFLEGKEVISVEKMIELHEKGHYILVTPVACEQMCRLLKNHGIYDYVLYDSSVKKKQKSYFEQKRDAAIASKEMYEFTSHYVNETDKLDLLQDITEYQKLTKQMLSNHDGKTYLNNRYDESGFYGNLNVLFDYAGISYEESKYFPVVSHNDAISPVFCSEISRGLVVSGEKYKRLVHKEYCYIPVYTVGPYIHYAKGIYSADQVRETKKRLGKVLTIFMPHSTEAMGVAYEEKKFVDEVLSCYKNQFDTIWACVYWADITHPICDYLQNKGVHIVSAGYRFDSLFDRRLKTIFELTDAVACGDGGTFVSYAIYYNIPVALFDMGVTNPGQIKKEYLYWETGYDYNYSANYAKVFNKELKITKKQRALMDKTSGFNKTREPIFFRHVLEISKDIWKFCNGDQSRYAIGVYSAYDYYVKNHHYEKALILREAVGDNFL